MLYSFFFFLFSIFCSASLIFTILSSRSRIRSFASVILLLILDFLIAQLVKTCLRCRRPWVDSWVRKIPWKRDRLPTPTFLGFPGGSDGKESAYNVGDLGSIPGLERSPREGKGYPLQYSGLENSMDYTVHGVAKSRTQLTNFHFHYRGLECKSRKSRNTWSNRQIWPWSTE